VNLGYIVGIASTLILPVLALPTCPSLLTLWIMASNLDSTLDSTGITSTLKASPSVTPSPTTTNSSLKTPSSPKKVKISRLRAKKWFLTYPQCPLPRQEAIENLLRQFPPVEWYIVSEETHKDGSPHLHIAVSFQQEFSSRDMKAFDKICGQHGNYQPMKNQRKCVEYVTKDGRFTAHGIDPESILMKKNGKTGVIAKLIAEGKTMKDIFEVEPGFVLMHKRKIEELQSWMQRRKEKEMKKEWQPFSPEDIQDLSTSGEQEIALWLNKNLKVPREFKQKQLYIWGPANMGKTSLINKLAEFLNVYYVPRDEDFYDDYEDGIYDLIVFDEFTNLKKMQWLNQVLDGQSMYLRKKGGQVLKKDNLPVIILSNYSVEQNYKKLSESGKLDPLFKRLEVVEVKEFIALFP